MARVREKCCSLIIEYSTNCHYACWWDGSGCHWHIFCPENGGWHHAGGWTPLISPGSEGSGDGARPPGATVRGDLEACAKALAVAWERRVTVPQELRGRRLRKRTITRTPEEVARALGLTLGPKRRPKRRPSKPRGGESLVFIQGRS